MTELLRSPTLSNTGGAKHEPHASPDPAVSFDTECLCLRHPFKHSKPCGNCRQHIPTDETVRGPAPLTSDQSFRLESGRDLPVFTRFEEPITVRVTGAPPQSLGSDLTKLLHRLQAEANISISHISANAQANMTIQAVSRAKIRRTLPHAACFVVPNISSIDE